MVTRYKITENEGTSHDAGRINSERTMEKGSTKKWMDGMKADADKEAVEAMNNLELTNESVTKRGGASAGEIMNAVDAALVVVNHQKEVLEGIKEGLGSSMTGHQMGARIASEKIVAKEYLGGQKEKALKVSGDTTTFGKRRAESSALEMAKGTFTQPVSER